MQVRDPGHNAALCQVGYDSVFLFVMVSNNKIVCAIFWMSCYSLCPKPTNIYSPNNLYLETFGFIRAVAPMVEK